MNIPTSPKKSVLVPPAQITNLSEALEFYSYHKTICDASAPAMVSEYLGVGPKCTHCGFCMYLQTCKNDKWDKISLDMGLNSDFFDRENTELEDKATKYLVNLPKETFLNLDNDHIFMYP